MGVATLYSWAQYSTVLEIPKSNKTSKRAKSLSSFLKFEPFADLFWLSTSHVRIYTVKWFKGRTYLCGFVFVCCTS